MILMFLTGAPVLDDIIDGLHMPCLKFGVDDDIDVPDWGWCP